MGLYARTAARPSLMVQNPASFLSFLTHSENLAYTIDFDQFDINHMWEYMNDFLNKTYGGMVVKVKTLWFVAVQS